MASTELLSKDLSDDSLEECVGSSELENRKPEEGRIGPEIFQIVTKSETVKNEISELLENIPQLKKAFVIVDKIGSGTFSSVYLASLKSRPGETLYALKHIIPTSHPSRIENELKCLLDIGGQDNVIEVKAAFRERDNVVFVMPYFAHDKFQDYVDQMRMDEIQLYMKSLLVALRRVHSIDLIHRDVKPSNFLFSRASKRFALVDFGLAQRSPVPLKSKPVVSSTTKLPVQIVPAKTDATNDDEGCAKRALSSPRKRKLDSVENVVVPRTKVPCLERAGDSAKAEGNSGKDSGVDVDRRLQPLDQNRPVTAVSFTTSSAVFKSTYSNSIKSPRRALLTRRAFDTHKESLETAGSATKGKQVSPEERKKLKMTKQTGDFGGSATRRTSVTGVCNCYGKPTVCNICMFRSIQQAPRAGTPGFRAPEVLMKFPNQSTAVDIWSAGVIFLSLLSGRYPFFKASDDMTSLAQIVSIFGYREVKAAAATYGKHLLVSPEVLGNNLKDLCEQLRCPAPLPRKNDGKRGSPIEASRTSIQVPDSAYDLLERLLDLNPFTRITAEEALKHKFFHEDLPKNSNVGSSGRSNVADLCIRLPRINVDH